jgi:DNA-binding ferritin-like protein
MSYGFDFFGHFSGMPRASSFSLLAANEKLVKDAEIARDFAGEVNDPESQDLMIGRITLHQKTAWMLKSFLK